MNFICIVCGHQTEQHESHCPQCGYISLKEKQTIQNKLVKSGQWKGYYAMSISHLDPLPCRKCNHDARAFHYGYIVDCPNPACELFMMPSHVQHWNENSGQKPKFTEVHVK